jgi:hypothetical protein
MLNFKNFLICHVCYCSVSPSLRILISQRISVQSYIRNSMAILLQLAKPCAIKWRHHCNLEAKRAYYNAYNF